MNKKLEWNVIRYDINSEAFEAYNIFNHLGFNRDLYAAKIKYLKQDCFRFDNFFGEIIKSLKYYFWGRTEWEIVLKDWPCGNKEEKIDVFKQIENNLNVFREYLFNNYKHIKKVK